MGPEKEATVHPLALLSVVDHYTRVAQGTSKRVVGTLLGETVGNSILVTSAFGVPFEEDHKDPTLWFLDHNFHEQMYAMHRKINRKERVVGWYSTGPKIKPDDLDIHEVFRKYCHEPVYVIVDVHSKGTNLPVTAYFSLELPSSERQFRRTFVHLPSEIKASEIEEVGVEHLLRDIKAESMSTLTSALENQQRTVKIMSQKLRDVAAYLDDVLQEKLASNPKIMYLLQDVFSMLPDLNDPALKTALTVHANDTLLCLYLGSVVRAVMALHKLITNKMENKRQLEAPPTTDKATTRSTKSEKTKSDQNSGDQ